MEILFTLLLGLAANGDPAAVNPGFEQLDERTGKPAGWSFTSLPDKPHLVAYDAMVIAAGDQKSHAIAISVAADHPDQDVAYNVHQDLQGMTAGKTYRVTAQVQTRGLTTAPMIVIQCLDAEGKKYLGFARSPEKQLAGDLAQWEQVETRITVPEGAGTVRLRIGIPAKGNAGGTAILDDVTVAEIE